jgi:hypothetical protein
VKLSDIIVSLKDTIAAKQRYLDNIREDIRYYGSSTADVVTAKFLEINIDELKKIVADLEKVE